MEKNNDLHIGPDGLARPPWAASSELLRNYYDTEWGMPVYTERELYERLCLEGFQAGLSWATVLKKRESFRQAFAGFDPEKVALFGQEEVLSLLDNKQIIRNKRKIEATITNARATLALRSEQGLEKLIWSYQPTSTPHPRTVADIPTTSPEAKALATELKKRGFTMVGPKSIFALMEAIGMVDTHLVGSHRRGSSGLWD